jgi:hypothetical protein
LAKPGAGAKFAPIKARFGLRDLFRVALWGISAASALFIALYAATTEAGRNRVDVALAEIHNILVPSSVKPTRPLDAAESRRLAETVRMLAVDRERLLARVATLEENMHGITSSIARVEKTTRDTTPPPAAAPSAAAATVEPAPAVPAPEDVTSSINPPSAIPVPPRPPATVSKAEFGLDLGNATSVEALRTAWTVALRRHGTLLEGLRPVVQTRERPRPGGTEFRLIAGPIAHAAVAARLCATMTAAGAICAPTVFEGQRLAIR